MLLHTVKIGSEHNQRLSISEKKKQYKSGMTYMMNRMILKLLFTEKSCEKKGYIK